LHPFPLCGAGAIIEAVRPLAAILVVFLGLSPFAATAQEGAPPEDETRRPYKDGESWPLRNFEGADFFEPFWPRIATARGDLGRIALGSLLPYGLLATGLALEGTDKESLEDIQSWRGLGLDNSTNNYALLWAFTAVAAAGIFLPAPFEDENGYEWGLRLDRATVLALGLGVTAFETEMLKKLFDRTRPSGRGNGSRPSGHASLGFAGAAFLSNVLRDALRPDFEDDLAFRLAEEVACAVPYLGATYVSLERIHRRKHFLTDTLLGGAIGTFTMQLFYAWSFSRTEQGRAWLDVAWASWDLENGGPEIAFGWRF
jgi:membrane-associated phospholipid phosphatase